MADFLVSQLDYIYFIGGLAFLSMGAACFAISRGQDQSDGLAWPMLGAFALFYGACEWLEMAALAVGDQPSFDLVRVALNTGSFMLLMEFGRLESRRFGRRAPGRWIYGPLGLAVVVGAALGGSNAANAANAVSGYLICLPGAWLVSWVLFKHAGLLCHGLRRLALMAGVAFLLFGAATGLVPEAAPFWPASVINERWFVLTTGVPIQLVRGALALGLGYAGWATWSWLVASELRSAFYRAHAHHQFFGASVALAAVMVGGWVLTDGFGDLYRRHVENDGRGVVELLSSRLNSDALAMDAMAKVLARSPSISHLLTGGDATNAQLALDTFVQVSSAEGGAIYDRAGALVAVSHRGAACLEAAAKDFPSLRAGARVFASYPANRSPYYCAGAPILSGGAVVGAAVLELSLAPFSDALAQMAGPSFLIDGDGVVISSNRPEMVSQRLWPSPSAKAATLTARYGRLFQSPLAARDIADGVWIDSGWRKAYVRRRFVANSPWSVVIMTPQVGITISRVLGILITFLVAVMVAMYLFGREHVVRGRLQMSRRLTAQKLAHDRALLATSAS
jgi:hypothetical protein